MRVIITDTSLVKVKVDFFRNIKKGVHNMPFIRRRRIWWKGVEGASSYVVYATSVDSLFAPENFKWEATPGIVSKEVTGSTQLIIPDDWPEFPASPGMYYIGITSKDDVGNQSDPFVSSGLFRFSPPPAPSQGGISDFS